MLIVNQNFLLFCGSFIKNGGCIMKKYIKYIVFILFVFCGSMVYWYLQRDDVSTDDATIDGNIVNISPKIAGYVTKLNVQDNQLVKAGDVLMEIDSSDYIIRRDKAQAALEAAQAAEKSSENTLEGVMVSSSSKIDSVTAQINSAEATWEKSSADRSRVETLFSSGICSRKQLDEVVATERSDYAMLEKFRADLRAANTAPAVVETEKNRNKQLDAQVKQAETDLTQAEEDLSHTKIVAPCDGRIIKRNIEIGNYVQVGQAMFSLVGTEIWVIANFKENQLEHVQSGQAVDIHIDAFPNEKLVGKVDSIQVGTGSYFSLFPAENATGNFVKIVQRVPVKIIFDSPVSNKLILGPGMSVVPTIHTARKEVD